MSHQQLLEKLRPRGVRELLQDLLAHRRRGGDSPRVTLHLAEGRDLTGWPLALDEDGHDGPCLLFQRAGGGTGPQDDLTYLPLGLVQALTVHGALGALEVLSGGALESIGSQPGPSPLALRRRCEALGRELSERLGGRGPRLEITSEGAPDSDGTRRSLDCLLTDTAAALNALVDEFGPQALASLEVVGLRHADMPRVVREGARLWVEAALDRGAAGRLDARAIKTEAAKLL
jgi:hypothetical protein